MLDRDSLRFFARVKLEVTSPFLIGCEDAEGLRDAVPVLDSNGLPTIPGSSLAGILRHEFRRKVGPTLTASLFGSSPKGGRSGTESFGSRLWVSWAHIHDSEDTPLDGLALEKKGNDPVLVAAAAGALRDHVRLSHRGSVDGEGKFDELVVCAGHRFTFDLVLEGEDEDEKHFDGLLGFLFSGALRIGRGGRRGLGRFRVIRCLRGVFDLNNAASALAWSKLSPRLDASLSGLKSYKAPRDTEGFKAFRLKLRPVGPWAFNGADPWLTSEEESSANSRTPDFNPVRSERIVWNKGEGRVEKGQLFVPGSSLKGAVAHRVAFHCNALCGRFSDQLESPGVVDDHVGEKSEAVVALFGCMRGGERARPGVVYFDDIWLDAKDTDFLRLHHNTINRFEGGTLTGHLFEERVLTSAEPLNVEVLVRDWDLLDATVKKSFLRALRDLCEQRLPLGAGAGRGHGVFEDPQAARELAEMEAKT